MAGGYGDDPEGPSSEDLERFGDEFRTCPECGSLVYDQAEVCQACGHVFGGDERGVPMWAIVVTAMLLLVLVLVLVVF